jgi:hypothetical protein
MFRSRLIASSSHPVRVVDISSQAGMLYHRISQSTRFECSTHVRYCLLLHRCLSLFSKSAKRRSLVALSIDTAPKTKPRHGVQAGRCDPRLSTNDVALFDRRLYSHTGRRRSHATHLLHCNLLAIMTPSKASCFTPLGLDRISTEARVFLRLEAKTRIFDLPLQSTCPYVAAAIHAGLSQAPGGCSAHFHTHLALRRRLSHCPAP